jgi:very-short-patch-repair endonuclease
MKSRNRTRIRLGDGKTRVTGNQITNPEKAELARQFRKKPTGAEGEAWSLLRGRRMLGLRFRRQQVIEGFIVDFYCPEWRIALEVDGVVHREHLSYDEERSKVLGLLGIRVLRIRNQDVTREVIERLLREAVPLSIHGEG